MVQCLRCGRRHTVADSKEQDTVCGTAHPRWRHCSIEKAENSSRPLLRQPRPHRPKRDLLRRLLEQDKRNKCPPLRILRSKGIHPRNAELRRRLLLLARIPRLRCTRNRWRLRTDAVHHHQHHSLHRSTQKEQETEQPYSRILPRRRSTR